VRWRAAQTRRSICGVVWRGDDRGRLDLSSAQAPDARASALASRSRTDQWCAVAGATERAAAAALSVDP
jgi:hypothetical protein